MDNQQEMRQVSVSEILKEHNLVVPEIQREYVWGKNQYGILDTFLEDIKSAFLNNNKDNREINVLENFLLSASEEEKIVLQGLLVRSKDQNSENLNLGFLYSYKPGYYISDEGKDAYLIDGQQRFTTLFLVLFYLAVKENKIDNFLKLFKVKADHNKIAFDYRVRMLTHNFILDMVNNVRTIDDLTSIKSKSWFLSNYREDTTVSAIAGDDNCKGALNLIHEHLHNSKDGLYEFTRENVKFWHFKTEETSQGEELYITMNSRGQQLADNETVRAVLFKSECAKKNPIYWSESWEIWQDFFWKNAGNFKTENLTADLGFNEFLRWIQICRMTELKTSINEDENDDGADKKEILKCIRWSRTEKLNTSYLELEEIELYFQALKYLYTDFIEEIKSFTQNYKDYKSFNLFSTEWLRPKDSLYNIGQIDLFRLLPVLYYCKSKTVNGKRPPAVKIFRFIRFFYNISRDPNVNKSPGNQIINALKAIEKLNSDDDITALLLLESISSTLVNAEERFKLKILSEHNDRYSAENILWSAEDIKINGGQINHLLELSLKLQPQNKFDIEIFTSVVKVFNEFIDNELFIWGNLLSTGVYNEYPDRIRTFSTWYKNKDFMALISQRLQISSTNLIDFFLLKKKEFIRQYHSAEDLMSEQSNKKQLYIYYILHTEIIDRVQSWNWEENGWCFGAWPGYKNYASIFNKPSIFQHYNQAWRENENKIISMHSRIGSKKKLIDNLLTWSQK